MPDLTSLGEVNNIGNVLNEDSRKKKILQSVSNSEFCGGPLYTCSVKSSVAPTFMVKLKTL